MDTRIEVENMLKHTRQYGAEVGETVLWWEFDRENTTFHDVYEGPPARAYSPPRRVTVLNPDEREADERLQPEGTKPLQQLRFAVTLDSLIQAGISNAHDTPTHLDDIVYYDGRYHEVRTYDVRARARADVLVIVEAVEVVLSEEYQLDDFPTT